MTIKKEDILNNLKKTAIDSEGKRLINMYLHLVNEGSKNDEYSRLLRNYKSNFPGKAINLNEGKDVSIFARIK